MTMAMKSGIVFVALFMGVIIGLALLNLRHFHSHSRANSARVSVRMVAAKAASFQLDVGRPPLALSELLMSRLPNWRGPYITVAQSFDPWGRQWLILKTSDSTRWGIASWGEDGEPHGEGIAGDLLSWRR
jgi:hypothetical protein